MRCKVKKLFLLVISLLAVGVLSSACGIPQEDYDALLAERDAAQAQVASFQPPAGVGKIALAVDMVRGYVAPQGPVCVFSSQFKRGEMVVFRVRMTDLETGDEIPANSSDLMAQATPPTMEEIGAMTGGITAIAHLSDGQSLPLHYGGHSPDDPADYFWSTSWVIPEDYPTGTIDYWVTVDWTAESKTGRFDPFNVFPAKLTIIE